MKGLNKVQFFKELGLENLPGKKQDEIWMRFLELVSLQVLDQVLDKLPQKEQELLFINLGKKPSKVEKFLSQNRLVRQLTLHAISKIKKEIAKKCQRALK